MSTLVSTNLEAIKIFRTKIDTISREQLFEEIAVAHDTHTAYAITTLNPEILLQARENKDYRLVLNASQRSVCDGFGLHFVFWRYGRCMKDRITGVDILEHLISKHQASESIKKKRSLVCVCAQDGLTSFDELRDALHRKSSDMKIHGITLLRDTHPNKLSQDDISLLAQADTVVCNFGAPQQEFFLAELKQVIPGFHAVNVGVGGGFDFLSGKIERAPKIMRRCGMEWLWRLIKQPKRLQRIIRAVIVFPLAVIFNPQLSRNKK